jgi:DNA mismatch repair ATPase MutL
MQKYHASCIIKFKDFLVRMNEL